MSRPVTVTLLFTKPADVAAIASAQSRSTAGSFTFDGSLVTGGVAAFEAGVCRPVVYNSTANENGKTYRVTGTVLYNGDTTKTVTEILTAAATSGSTTRYFFEVIGITSDGATAGTVSWGINNTGASYPLAGDFGRNPFDASFAMIVTGVPIYTFQYTFDNLFEQDANPTWYADSTYTDKTTNLNGNIVAPCSGVRIKNTVAAATGSVKLIFTQAGYK